MAGVVIMLPLIQLKFILYLAGVGRNTDVELLDTPHRRSEEFDCRSDVSRGSMRLVDWTCAELGGDSAVGRRWRS